MNRMHIGLDFDNTLIDYNAIIHRAAVEQGLIPTDFPVDKSEIRNALRRAGLEDAWTEMQGYIYGVRIKDAQPFTGAIDFLVRCREAAIPVCIISHKTRYPYRGDAHDLHLAADRWLERMGAFDAGGAGLSRANVFYEPTKDAKIERIQAMGCTHFIDDLPEFLSLPEFPGFVERILFDPAGAHAEFSKMVRADSWNAIRAMLLPS